MTTAEDMLKAYSGKRVLDVATGDGAFIHTLIAGLSEYTEIIGIDQNDTHQGAFEHAFHDRTNIHFARMDAANLEFSDASFDIVSISNSLHHMPDYKQVLAEMLRVLCPDGVLIISEMYRDVLEAAQTSHVEFHHWRASIDRARGIYHRETFSRAELEDIVLNLRLEQVQIADIDHPNDDPRNPELLDELNRLISQNQALLISMPDREELDARGEALREKLARDGFERATTLMATGTKRST